MRVAVLSDMYICTIVGKSNREGYENFHRAVHGTAQALRTNARYDLYSYKVINVENLFEGALGGYYHFWLG